MGKIFCIMGKSSSGKDTIYKVLLENKELKLNRIIPYTTRPIRDGERDGQEYFFINNSQLKKLQDENKIIEIRNYNTCFGLWSYLTVHDNQIDLNQNNYIYIGTPEAFLSIREHFGRDKVVPVLIELDDGVRLQRALDRERKQAEPKYDELCRRYLSDQQDFSEEKLKECGIEKRFYNDSLEECIDTIRGYIQEIISNTD